MAMKSPNVNLTDVLKKLSFLRNNLALLVPIIIAIVALLLFIPTKILQGRLKAEIQKQSVQTASRIRSLVQDVNEAAQAKAMEGYVNAYAQDANQIELLMKQTTMRELLSYELFPDTNEASILLFERFGGRYIAGVEAMLAGLNSGGPPADTEIELALANAPRPFGRSGASRSGSAGYGAGFGGRRRSYRMMSEMDRKIVDRICRDKAAAARVYASPVDIDGYTYWNEWKFENRDKAYRECWYWQIGYWVLEDIATTIREMNKDADSILDAPIKRVMNADFTLKQRRMAPGRGGARRAARRDKDKGLPSFVTSAKDGMTTPCTGRYSNEEIDVMHFNLRLVLNAGDVLRFMQELCSAKPHTFRGYYGDQPEQTFKHNQITVLETNIAPVDREGYEHELYRYGDNAIVELDLIGEYVLPRVGYDEIRPRQVIEDLTGEGEAAG